MTKTVELDITIKEILVIMRQCWKLILVLAIVFTVLCGGYGLHKAKSEAGSVMPVTEEQQAVYEADTEDYEVFLESQDNQPRMLKSEWVDLYDDQKNNPIFNVDPYNCEYEQIVIRFADKGNYDKTIANWIADADTEKLFDDSAGKMSPYRTSLIFTAVDEDEYETQYDPDESVIQLIEVEGFDSSKAAEYMSSYIRQRAETANMDIQGISSAHISGYNVNVAAYQRKSRDATNAIYNTLNSISNMKNVYSEPTAPQTTAPSRTKKAMKYGLAGLILGIVLGAGLAIFLVLRKGFVISRRQIEDIFELELLSDFSHGSEAAVEVLNANLDVMSGGDSKIMLIGDSEKETMDLASKCSAEGDREYIAGCNLFDDAVDIEALQATDGITLCIRLGESNLDKIQRVLLRTNKLGKPVLGYVLI